MHAIGGTPVIAGQHVDFAVTGQNAGATGACVPVTCVSDANGNVTFTYTDSAGAGDDTIKSSFTDNFGSLQTATAQKHWIAGTTRALTVTLVGSGSVASTPSGIDCGATCSASFTDGSIVGLTATPAAGFAFGGWSGGCTGTTDCNVTMSSDQAVTATFTAIVNGTPVANPQSVTTPQDTPVPITLTGSDPESDPLTYAISSSPTHGALAGTGALLTYTPAAGYTGTDSFAFTVSDGVNTSTPATVSITVTETGKPPTCHFHGKHGRGEAWHVRRDHHWLHVSNGHHGGVMVVVWINRTYTSMYLGDGEQSTST